MKTFFKILRRVVGVIVILLIAAVLSIQLPAVQRYVARKVISSLEESTVDGHITFENIRLHPFRGLVLSGVTVTDNHPFVPEKADSLRLPRIDTLLKAESIVATFTLRSLLGGDGLDVRRVSLKGVEFNLAIEDGTTNVERIFGIEPDPDSPPYTGNLFQVRKVEVDDSRFRMVNFENLTSRERGFDGGIDWDDMDVRFSLRGNDVSYKGGILKATAGHLSMSEKCGYVCDDMSGEVTVRDGGWFFKDLRINDEWSQIHLPVFNMEYEEFGPAFKDFLRKVSLRGNIKNSRISMETLRWFAPDLTGMKAEAFVNAWFEGPVADFKVTDFSFRESLSGIGGKLKLGLQGLPDASSMTLDGRAEGLRFTTASLTTFVNNIAPGTDIDLRSLAPGENFTFNGDIKGILNDLRIKGVANSEGDGSLTADAYIKGVMDHGAMRLGGDISTSRLNIGRILGTDAVGECTLRTRIHSSLGKKGIDADFDTLVVDRLKLLGYEYTDIIGKGTFRDNAFNGRIACLDPAANFIFRGYASLPGETAEGDYDFTLTVGGMDMHRLGYPGDGRAEMAMHSNVKFRSSEDGTMRGRIDINDLVLRNDEGRHDIGGIHILAKDGANDIRMRSDFATARFSGSESILRFVEDLKALTIGRELSLLDPGCKEWSGADYSLELKIADVSQLVDFFAPELYIENGTSLNASVSKEGNLSGSLRSPILAYGKNYIRQANLDISDTGNGLRVKLKGERMDVAGIEMLSPAAVLLADDNVLGASFSFADKGNPPSGANLLLTGGLSRSERDSLILTASIDPSTYIQYEGDRWDISSSDFTLGNGRFSISDKVRAYCGEQWIEISGGLSPELSDVLHVDMQDFDISLVNSFLDPDFGIRGFAGGRIEVLSPYDSGFGLLAELSSRNTEIAGRPAGTLNIASRWNDNSRCFDINADNDIDGRKTLSLAGKFYTRDNSLDATADLDGLDIGYISPFLEGIFSEFGGAVSGKVVARGPLEKLRFTTREGRISGGILRLDFTGVRYNIDGPVVFNDRALSFDGCTVTDGEGGKASARGGLKYNMFQDMNLDIGIEDIRNLKAIDLRSGDNDIFWGDISVDGKVSVKGPVSRIAINVDATTKGEGEIHIPLDYSSDATSGLLTFVDESTDIVPVIRDRFEEKIRKMEESKESGTELDVAIRVRATPEVEAHIEIDPASGNILTGTGRGDISMGYSSSSGAFTMGGDYTINSGKFHFSAMNIATRDFELERGGTVRFKGDVMDTELDVNAVYKTKTSLAALLADSTVTRTTVNCLVNVTDKLRSPKVKLDIQFPDITEPIALAKAQSALMTEDQIQKQFLSLLISNTFLPSEQNGIVNNSNSNLLSSVADVMSSQLNSILEQLDIPLDLGFNYQPTDSGDDLFDVAVSTQLFHDRLTVSGNFGNRQYGRGDMTGDLEVGIKLNRKGSLNFNLFSRSSDIYKGYLDNLQRNGGGFTIQTDFTTFSELAHRILDNKAKRREREMQELENAAIEDKNVIRITADDKR